MERGLQVERHKTLPVRYRGVNLDCGCQIDVLVERTVVVESTAVERLERIHEARLLSYLKLSGCPIGLLMNFNVTRLMDGIRRLVNHFNDDQALRVQRSLR